VKNTYRRLYRQPDSRRPLDRNARAQRARGVAA
jgi:hypothetical protein